MTKASARRKRESRKRGKLRGLGIGSFLEVTAPPSKELGGIVFEADGSVTVADRHAWISAWAMPRRSRKCSPTGSASRSIKSVWCRATATGWPSAAASGGSKSIMSSGTAFVQAAEKVIDQGKQIASHVLEAAAVGYRVRGRAVHHRRHRPRDRHHGAGAENSRRHQSAGGRAELARRAAHQRRRARLRFPNGCHVAEVEIDPATGVIEVVKYSCVNDFGTVINPMIVEGQLHGGVVQGIGQALMEMTAYDDDGQFLTGSYMDYALPRASDTPNFSVASHPVPATTNPLGVKGCGEAGCAGALTSVMNAVVDALSEYGIRHIDMPATPYRVWQAIHEAGSVK